MRATSVLITCCVALFFVSYSATVVSFLNLNWHKDEIKDIREKEGRTLIFQKSLLVRPKIKVRPTKTSKRVLPKLLLPPKPAIQSVRKVSPSNKVIHFVYLELWPGGSTFQENLRQWRRVNPQFTITVWSLKLVNALFREYFPDTFHIFQKSSPIQKSDLARYAILAAKGGWYFDLDVTIHCKANARVRGGFKCQNDMISMEQADFFKKGKGGGGTLFFERQPLSKKEQVQSTKRTCRRNIPEYKNRLANYALHSNNQQGQFFFRNVLYTAICRVAASTSATRHSSTCTDPEYNILFTTGPDVLTEVAYGNRQVEGECGKFQIPLSDNAKKYSINIVDPKLMVMNANSFTWRGSNNKAMLVNQTFI